MKNKTKKNIKHKVKKEQIWLLDRFQTVIIERNYIIILIISSIFVTIISTIIVLFFSSSDKINPILMENDNISGAVKISQNKQNTSYSFDESLRRHFIIKYIKAREEFDIRKVRQNKDILLSYSKPEAYSSFTSPPFKNEKNIENIYTRKVILKDFKYIKNKFNSDYNESLISFIKIHGIMTARLRVVTEDYDKNGNLLNKKHWIINISFSPDMKNIENNIKTSSSEDSIFYNINPLYFQVFNYNKILDKNYTEFLVK